MADILRLNPPIPLNTSLGAAQAHFLISYGPEQHLYWFACLDHNGQWWKIPNPQVRGQRNWSMDRPVVEYPKMSTSNDIGRRHPSSMQKPNGS